MDLCTLIERNAAYAPDKAAIRFEGHTLSYSGFNRRIGRVSYALKHQLGIKRGDRIAILSLNRPDYLTLLYACARLGAILVPLNWRLAAAEQLFILSDSGAKVLVLEQAFKAVLPALTRQLPDISLVGLDFAPPGGSKLDDFLDEGCGDERTPGANLSCPLLIVYTSGTTGRPKGAVLRQDALLWNGVMSQHMHDLTSTDHALTVLPLFHVGGLNIQTTPGLHHGATVTIQSRFSPEATFDAFEHDRPTLAALVPAMMQALTDHPRWASTDLSALKAICTGSTMVPQRLVERFARRGVPVLQVYGATETSPIAVYTKLGADLAPDGASGLPGLCCEAAIIDDVGTELPPGTPGEIAIRGPNVFCGYWRDQQATREAFSDGWYRTGDIGRCDADGYFWVRDRKKNLIISGGENIYPAEVERVLMGQPDVAECAVVGRPDPRWEEVPIAYVVRRPESRIAAEALLAHVQSQLARFKVPREIIFTHELPKTALGKVQHFMLKELHTQSSPEGDSN
ncbi:class I adenylate-forming enzyme family protein [Bradyrhizobium elkanii]|uniref:class I adenylate-forming enzyme family protein n=1 Tax=Bradyrhizobium elkanii TaxID=29448 RepID=UPI001BAA228D|nr:long-chain fatty acid--CoA ligase [Bradyrhizobium elkanii]MBR1164531.1 long-chain fatty acid--CoA ligase [Bradyrhizobium elkanii]